MSKRQRLIRGVLAEFESAGGGNHLEAPAGDFLELQGDGEADLRRGG